MKLITLNVWGGRHYKDLINFFKKYSNKTDIFCLQEVFDSKCLAENTEIRTNFYSEVSKVLSNFNGFFAPAIKNYDNSITAVNFDLFYGLAIFVNKNIKIDSINDFFVYRNRFDVKINEKTKLKEIPRNLQHIHFKIKNKKYIVANLHGIWTGGGKEDNYERIQQSNKVNSFLCKEDGAKILCGDFNLLPTTESLKILEKDMVNLVKKYGVTSTRSHYYTKENKFADYILVSDDVKVKDFKVLEDVVSDHLPLYLEFE